MSIDPGTLDDICFINQLPQNEISTQNEASSDVPKLSGNILLAEDVVINQQLISIFINKTGAQLDIVSDGKQAVDAALSNEYDLILMDMQMPVMDGIEAIKILKERGYSKPIIALTANVLKKEKDECYESGCNGFVAKPIDKKEFYDALEKFLPPQP